MATSQSQNLPTPASDMRSFAKEARRDVEQKVKWAKGGMSAPGKRCPHGVEVECICRDRPLRKQSRASRRAEKLACRKGTVRPEINTEDLFAPTSDSSADERIHYASATQPAPDAEIMYSYDAAHGPAKGNQILSLAISKAVERYESQETEKLAKEYEFIDGKENEDGAYFADEDDFEIVGHDSF